MIESRSPQDPSDIVVAVEPAGAERVVEAVRRARSAQTAWASSATTRSAAMSHAAGVVDQAARELTDLIVREVGKPHTEAAAEVQRAVSILRYYAQQVYDSMGEVHEPSSSGLLYSRRGPIGVAGLITPWNFPLAIPVWKAAPALAFGNAVVLKPAPEATGVALRLGELLAATLPDVFAVVPGDVEEGRALVSDVDAVSFTGSTVAGTEVAVAATVRGIPVQAEMGGQNPAIVLPDADHVAAARQIASAAMGFAGQKCTATKRVILVGDAGQFRDVLVSAVEALALGDPSEAVTAVGPVIDAGARERVLEAAATAVASGGRVLTGGRSVDRGGWFVEPTVVEGVPPDHVLACEEVFGPICLVQSAASEDEAYDLANDVQHGLAAALYTRSLSSAISASERLEAGLVKVNSATTGVDFYLPFGGQKASSIGGREQGKAARDFFTRVRTVSLAPS